MPQTIILHDRVDRIIGTKAIIGSKTAVEPAHHWPAGRKAAGATTKQLPLRDDLAFVLVAALRQHGHIGNVLTHISGTDWRKVEQALRSIVDLRAGSRELSPLARNIVELICADHGVTGRIMKPFFRRLASTVLGAAGAARLNRHIEVVFQEMQSGAHRFTNTAATTKETADDPQPAGEPN